jgi:hypothetical protein
MGIRPRRSYDMELWKDVVGYEGYYQVSSLGRVRSLDRVLDKPNILTGGQTVRKGKLLKQRVAFGYLTANLCVHDRRRGCRVHRLVAEAFIPNPENKPQINHKNGNKRDNRVYNLEWATASENGLHSYANGWSQVVNRKPVVCVDLQKTFDSSYSAAEWLNNNRFGNTRKVAALAGKIRLCAQGKRHTACDYRWRFVG